jgi:hypothetical protein
MLDAKAQTRLQQLLRRESRSFLQYVREAFPWITPEEKEALAQLHTLIEEERGAIAALAKFLMRHRILVPHLGPYPVAFTNLNFVTLDHLLPLLVDAQRRAIADLEHDLESFTDPECRQELQKILDVKRQHLKTLEALALANPETVLH